MRRADEAGDQCRRAEHVGVHHEDRPGERSARRPEGENRSFAVARVGEDTDTEARGRRIEGGAHRFRPEAHDDRHIIHPGRRERVEQAAEQALSADLDEAFWPSAGPAVQAFANASGEQDRRHAPSTAASASRKLTKSASVKCPMFATRKMSCASRPWPS